MKTIIFNSIDQIILNVENKRKRPFKNNYVINLNLVSNQEVMKAQITGALSLYKTKILMPLDCKLLIKKIQIYSLILT